MVMKTELIDRVVGPGFHQQVYDKVREVPIGYVTTYGDVATILGSPRVARHVGWALSALMGAHTDVPWHRVINARGRISFKGQSFRAQRQRQLLEHEGIAFSDSGVINLKAYRWFWTAIESH